MKKERVRMSDEFLAMVCCRSMATLDNIVTIDEASLYFTLLYQPAAQAGAAKGSAWSSESQGPLYQDQANNPVLLQ
jgi:hypothetical protein